MPKRVLLYKNLYDKKIFSYQCDHEYTTIFQNIILTRLLFLVNHHPSWLLAIMGLHAACMHSFLFSTLFPVWKFFIKSIDSEATWKICNKVEKSGGKGGGANNLSNHLKRNHTDNKEVKHILGESGDSNEKAPNPEQLGKLIFYNIYISLFTLIFYSYLLSYFIASLIFFCIFSEAIKIMNPIADIYLYLYIDIHGFI